MGAIISKQQGLPCTAPSRRVKSFIWAVIQSPVASAAQRESGIRVEATLDRAPPTSGVPASTLFPISFPSLPFPPTCLSIRQSVCGTSEVKNRPGCTKAATPCLIDVGISLRVYVSSISVFYIYIYLLPCLPVPIARAAGALGLVSLRIALGEIASWLVRSNLSIC